MTFVDTNVLIDIFEDDADWLEWSMNQVSLAASRGELRVDPIVVAELSRGFDSCGSLRAALERMEIILAPLDEESAFLAGKRFQGYRRARDREGFGRVLPDFLIGAHALLLGETLLTRDSKVYRHYFPELTLITPETHPNG